MKAKGSQFETPTFEGDPRSIPRPTGETPIPEGMVRFHHYTNKIENLPSIMSQGLLQRHAEESYARGGTEYPQTFATAGVPNADFKRSHAFVEGWADPVNQLSTGRGYDTSKSAEHAAHLEGRRSTITFGGDVPPEQLVGAHQPWHEMARYMAENEMGGEIARGEYDWINRETSGEMVRGYQPALKSMKISNAATVMLGGKL